MNKEFIPYEQALELKELGFDEECLMLWCKYHAINRFALQKEKDQTFQPSLLAPLYQQAFRWFRENHSISSYIEEVLDEDDDMILYEAYIKSPNGLFGPMARKTYEEAELACLKKLIEIVKNK